ncbi:hypothetical protein [Absidia glauca]|uniref:Uncharacterized protein n=1 Tax=Absidia glauca TaxID=4829 RepID=A0A168MDW1_ABSGL|nr:hypothetical protein [Absidia glauca]
MSRKKRASVSKDRFIDLAQAALEEADLEDDKKGVLEQVVEALVSTTGAPMLAEVIAAQLASQDVIERRAEQHFLHEQSRTSTPESMLGDLCNKDDNFKEHDDPATLFPPSPPPDLASPSSADDPFVSSVKHTSYWRSTYTLSDYLWRLFRILILASFVALLYQFYRHHRHYFTFLD